MAVTSLILVEVELEDPRDDERLLAWADSAGRLLRERARLASERTLALGEGRFLIEWGFPLPGGFAIVRRDRRWHELDVPARVTIRQARVMRRTGNPREITAAELETLPDALVVDAREKIAIDAPKDRTIVLYCNGYD